MHISLIYYLSVTINMNPKTNLVESVVFEELNCYLQLEKFEIFKLKEATSYSSTAMKTNT